MLCHSSSSSMCAEASYIDAVFLTGAGSMVWLLLFQVMGSVYINVCTGGTRRLNFVASSLAKMMSACLRARRTRLSL